MSHNKFLSLISSQAVHLAPNRKVIPANEIATLISSLEVLDRIREEAKAYQQEVVKECEQLKEQAQKEGFEAGFGIWSQHIAELEAEIATVHKAMEKTVIPVALKAARKILGREIELSETAISDIVANNLKAVSQHKRVTIYVNKEDLSRLEKKREDLKRLFEGLEALSLRPREDITRGGCVIETEAGIINAKLESMWDAIERAFQLINQETTKE